MENDDLSLLELDTLYIEKLGQFFFHTYSLTWLNQDTSVLLKVKNIWISSKVKYGP